MRYCEKCHKLVKKMVVNSKLIYACTACGKNTPVDVKDNIMYDDKKTTLLIVKSGENIYNYPCNPKIRKPCLKCKYPIVAWEKDAQQNKTFGCKCGHAWIELV